MADEKQIPEFRTRDLLYTCRARVRNGIKQQITVEEGRIGVEGLQAWYPFVTGDLDPNGYTADSGLITFYADRLAAVYLRFLNKETGIRWEAQTPAFPMRAFNGDHTFEVSVEARMMVRMHSGAGMKEGDWTRKD